MTLANATVLYAHLNKIGRKEDAENLLIRYPQLKEPVKIEPEVQAPKTEESKEIPKADEVKKSGKVRKG